MGAQCTDRDLCGVYNSVPQIRRLVEYTAVITWLFDIDMY